MIVHQSTVRLCDWIVYNFVCVISVGRTQVMQQRSAADEKGKGEGEGYEERREGKGKAGRESRKDEGKVERLKEKLKS